MSKPAAAVIRRRHFLLTALGISLVRPIGRALSAAGLPTSSSAEEAGAALAAELRRQPPDLNTEGVLRRRDPKGRWLPAFPIRLELQGASGTWESLYRVFAPSGALIETLTITHTAGGNRYTLRRAAEPAGGAAAQNLQGNAASVPLAGTDFWLCDLGLEFLYWPAQRITRTEMRKGRSCRVLESVNPRPESGAYARVLSWVDIESGGLLRAEALGQDGRRMKEFNIGSLKKIEGRFQLKSMEIRDERADTRTRIEFELELAE